MYSILWSCGRKLPKRIDSQFQGICINPALEQTRRLSFTNDVLWSTNWRLSSYFSTATLPCTRRRGRASASRCTTSAGPRRTPTSRTGADSRRYTSAARTATMKPAEWVYLQIKICGKSLKIVKVTTGWPVRSAASFRWLWMAEEASWFTKLWTIDVRSSQTPILCHFFLMVFCSLTM